MSKHAEPEAVIKRDWPIEVALIAKLAKLGQLFTTANWTMCNEILCKHAWLMAWWRFRKLTANANINELVRSKCKAEQCIRDI